MDELYFTGTKTKCANRKRLLKPAQRKHLRSLAALLGGGAGIYLLMCLALYVCGVM